MLTAVVIDLYENLQDNRYPIQMKGQNESYMESSSMNNSKMIKFKKKIEELFAEKM